MAPQVDEQETTMKVNHLLMELQDHLVRVWTTLSHLGECRATKEAAYRLNRMDVILTELRAQNYDVLRAHLLGPREENNA